MVDNINVTRPSLSEEQFRQMYDASSNSKSILSCLQNWKNEKSFCSSKWIWNFLTSILPVLKWLPKYKKKYIAGDCIAGWTVGIIRIPQGMAYALLAGVQPVYGLYSCFFPVLLWFLFSTSRHTSVEGNQTQDILANNWTQYLLVHVARILFSSLFLGTMAVVCLMIQNLISLHVSDLEIATTSNSLLVNGRPVDVSEVPTTYLVQNENGVAVLDNASYVAHLQEEHELEKINIACTATLLVGIIQLAMAFFRLGFLTTLLSDPVIQGFTTGSAFHVMTSQVKYLFGLDKVVGKYNGPFALFKTYVDIFANLPRANPADIVISVVCLSSLFVVKYLNERFKKKLRNVPVPIELILVVVTTLISYFCHLDEPPYNVNIVKTIPTGFPSFAVPKHVNLWSDMATDCVIMAFISVAISLSLTKIYADKHGYEIDANQEIFALGVCNTFPAFLSSFAVAASLSRTAIQESTGGKTQLVGILSSILMLIVLLWLAPLFQPVPKSALACIIIVALKSLFIQFANLKPLWRISKFDLLVWLVTCLSVIVLGVDIGLAVGVAMAIAGLLYRIQHPRHALLGRILHTDIYADKRKYRDAEQLAGVRIFHYADSISFTNKDAFRNSLYDIIGCNPSRALGKLKKTRNATRTDQEKTPFVAESYTSSSFSHRASTSEQVRRRNNFTDDEALIVKSPLPDFDVLIFDATMWSFVDWTAGREIMQIIDNFKALGIVVLLAGPSRDVLKTLDSCGLPSRVAHDHVFVTVHDAAVRAEQFIRARMKRDDRSDSFEDLPGYPGYDALAL